MKIYSDYSVLTVKHGDSVYEFRINLVGLYNAYNVLGAVACALENGIGYETIKSAVLSYQSILGGQNARL